MTLVYALDHQHAASPEDLTALVGGKAANLGVMARDLGLPVPPGFVITTEACRRVLDGDWPGELEDELREAVARVEERVGRRFGDPADPLLVSVRSGAPVSMPGMMDTILDIGVTSATARGWPPSAARRSRPTADAGWARCSATSSPRVTRRTTPGSSFVTRSRRCSGRG